MGKKKRNNNSASGSDKPNPAQQPTQGATAVVTPIDQNDFPALGQTPTRGSRSLPVERQPNTPGRVTTPSRSVVTPVASTANPGARPRLPPTGMSQMPPPPEQVLSESFEGVKILTPEAATGKKRNLEIDLIWDKSGKGSFNNPYRSIEDKRQNHSGTKGKRIKLTTNHFPMSVECETLYRYGVKFYPPWKRPIGKRDKPLLYRAIEAMKKKHAMKELPQEHCIVFDGLSTILSIKQFKNLDTSVNIPEDPESKDKLVEMKIKLVYEGKVPLKSAIDAFEKGQMGKEVQPLQAVQMLNIIMTYAMAINPQYEVMGPKYFQPGKKDRVVEIDAGKYVWQGFFASVRVGWKIRLNVDMANKPAYMKTELIEFLANYLHSQGKHCPKMEDFIYLLTRDRFALELANKELKDLKARFIRPDGAKRDYRMNKLVKDAHKQKFKLESGEMMTVFDYFKKQYKYTMKYPELPLVHVGDPKKNNYLPLECLELKQQVCPQSKVLGNATSNMIRVTAIRPDKRQERIKQSLVERKKNPYAEKFGISVQENFGEINARILDAPVVAYNSGKSQPRDGKWNASGQFVKAKPLAHWAVLDTVTLFPDQLELFIKSLMDEALKMGMSPFRPQQVIKEKDFRNISSTFEKLTKANPRPEIVLVLSEDKSSDIYQQIKLLGDTELNIPTQFVLRKNATGKGKGQPPSPATIHNILLKINSKLDGTNQALAPSSRAELTMSNKPIFDRPVMVVGADVTHPAPDQLGFKPSIAAVVASIDPAISRYISEIRVQFKQEKEVHVTEQILDMQGIFRKLLERFYMLTKQKPQRVIFYRDGVSEGQFEMVLNKEISAMQKACASLNPNYQPGMTYFVAQKRHHTRLFPEANQGLRNGNVRPGTVVDTDIVHPTVSSFFLASHEGIQGTTKPTYYVKLYDDNNLSADVEQALTYYLCHLYSRCERSVSYPAPTYNAHLAAFRARDHHEALLRKHDYGIIPREEIEKVQNVKLPNYFV